MSAVKTTDFFNQFESSLLRYIRFFKRKSYFSRLTAILMRFRRPKKVFFTVCKQIYQIFCTNVHALKVKSKIDVYSRSDSSSSSDDTLSSITTSDESYTEKINSEAPLTKHYTRRCSSVSSTIVPHTTPSFNKHPRKQSSIRHQTSADIVFDIAL